ncbi:helix-turn-helix domain-containing protein [Alkaliphilus crotonatoxidans]
MKIISTGEKIKQLRIDIGLNQDDLTNDEITRSLISMIENNKRNLTYRAAKVIADSLNQYYINLGKKITPDYLLESEVEQAQRLIKERLDEMQQLIDHPMVGNENQVVENFKKLIEFARQWKLDSMVAQLYETRGKYYFNTYRYNEAISDSISAQEYYLEKKNYDKAISLYIRIGNCHYQLMLYDQALLYYNRAFNIVQNYSTENTSRDRMLLHYNLTLCYSSQKKYDSTLQEIASFKQLPEHEEDIYNLMSLLEANTYRDLRNYDKAIRLYNKLLKKQLSVNTKMLVFENFSQLYQAKEDYEKSLQYIDVSFEFKDDIEANYLPYLYLNKSRIYWKLGKIKNAISLIENGLILAEKVAKFETILDLHFLLVEIYLETNKYVKAKNILEKLECFIIENNLKDMLFYIYTYYIDLCYLTGEMEKCLIYTSKLRAIRSEGI